MSPFMNLDTVIVAALNVRTRKTALLLKKEKMEVADFACPKKVKAHLFKV
jgi:hypothetical protein